MQRSVCQEEREEGDTYEGESNMARGDAAGGKEATWKLTERNHRRCAVLTVGGGRGDAVKNREASTASERHPYVPLTMGFANSHFN